jgi:hypothetical protein
MAIEEYFRRFASSLELSAAETQKAADIQNRIRELLEAHPDVFRTELSGSYDRKTKIRPLHDIDVLIVFDPQVAYDATGDMIKPRQFISRVSRLIPSLRRKLPRLTGPKPQSRSVNIALDGIGFDLVPAFCLSGGGFLIPDSTQQKWTPTDPLKYAERLSALNQTDRFAQQLVPFIKMIKSWARVNAPLLKSYLIELLILNCLPSIESYSDACPNFFLRASTEVLGSVCDPITDIEVNELLPLQRLEVMRQFRKSLNLSIDAKVAEALRRPAPVSARHFAQVFGPKFPVTISP